jgi:tRNA U34 5-carboxymethylaminomethyl modifying enzyme MnmG/GidA
MIYKVSYVVVGGGHPGAIANADSPPRVGDHVTLGEQEFEVLDVVELMPPRGGFTFLHATCQLIDSEKPEKEA